jgi:hypothetical protein
VCGPNITGAAGPVIHLLLPWTPLIIAPEEVETWYLGSVSRGMTVRRWGRPSRGGWPYSVLCDEPPSLRDTCDCLGMTVVAVDKPDKWTH